MAGNLERNIKTKHSVSRSELPDNLQVGNFLTTGKSDVFVVFHDKGKENLSISFCGQIRENLGPLQDNL